MMIVLPKLDKDDYYILGSLDLSDAFNVVHRNLLFKRKEIMRLVVTLQPDLRTVER